MYSNYNAEELCEAPGFVSWVRQNDRESEKYWENWVKNNPNRQSEVAKARALLLAMGVEEPQPTSTEIKSLWNRIDQHTSQSGEKPFYKSSSVLYKIAAAAVVAGLVAAVALNSLYPGFLRDEGSLFSDHVVMVEKICPVGQKSTITLTDGTRIKLNSNSKLVFPETFSNSERTVELEGEAFFEVSKDPSRPFVITSGNIKTQVLGTSFNIKAYPNANNISVAVATGKVAVGTTGQKEGKAQLTLLPKEMAIYSNKSESLIKTSFNPLQEMAWKDGILYFNNKDIHEITSELVKWYGVTFVIDKKLNTEKDYTGSFDNKSLEEVLQGISFVFGFKFEINNKVVTIN